MSLHRKLTQEEIRKMHAEIYARMRPEIFEELKKKQLEQAAAVHKVLLPIKSVAERAA